MGLSSPRQHEGSQIRELEWGSGGGDRARDKALNEPHRQTLASQNGVLPRACPQQIGEVGTTLSLHPDSHGLMTSPQTEQGTKTSK